MGEPEQRICRDLVHAEGHDPLGVSDGLVGSLSRNSVDEVHIHEVEAATLRGPNGLQALLRRVVPAQRLEQIWTQGLDTETDAVDASDTQPREQRGVRIPRMDFNPDLGAMNEMGAYQGNDQFDQLRSETGCSAAEVQGPHGRRIGARQVCGEFPLERSPVVTYHPGLEGDAIVRAMRAQVLAEREMHVEVAARALWKPGGCVRSPKHQRPRLTAAKNTRHAGAHPPGWGEVSQGQVIDGMRRH